MKVGRALAGLLPKGRSSLVRAVATVSKSPHQFLAECAGFRVLIDIDEHVSATLYNYHTFEPKVIQIFESFIAPGDVVFDVGANFDWFSLVAARRTGSRGKVYAFEPDPRNIERLRANVAANSLDQFVEIIPKGITDRTGVETLYLAPPEAGNVGRSTVMAPSAARNSVAINIQTTTVDEFIHAGDIPTIAMLKMDIEGAELAAIKGASDSLRRNIIKAVLMEIHPAKLGPEGVAELGNLMAHHGYNAWFLDEAMHDRRLPAPVLVPLVNGLADASFNGNAHFVFVRSDLKVPVGRVKSGLEPL